MTSLAQEGVPLVAMTGITKRFAGNTVLRSVSLDVRPGEVHALLGENGAGKSTLMKILLGVHAPDEGSITLKGKTLTGGSTRDRLDVGVAMIFQELSLVPGLSVADNIFLGREPVLPLGLIDRRRIRGNAAALIKERRFELDPASKVETLPFAARQQVEILKALSRGASVIVMDEPTSSLTVREEKVLHETINRLRDQGIGIIFISHRMPEIFLLADRLSVLKDGMMKGPFNIGDITPQDVNAMMLRSDAPSQAQSEGRPSQKDFSSRESVLRVENLTTKKKLRDIGFSIRPGEVVGIAGLVGSGRTTLAQALFGLLDDVDGRVVLNGKNLSRKSPAERISAGMAMVPEDRRKEGLVTQHSLSSNMVLPNLDDLLTRFPGVLSGRRERNLYKEYRTALGIASRGPRQLAEELSGGNQQKVVFAKWLAGSPQLLILDEPTSGVDVNAKVEMRSLVRKAAAEGLAVLLITSELDELAELSDRLLFMVDGHLVERRTDAHTETEIRNVLQTLIVTMEHS